MPNTDGYHIRVSYDVDDNDSPIAGQKQEKTYGEKSAASLEKGIKGLVSFGAVKRTAQTIIGHSVSTIELRTGAAEYEQQVQFTYDRISEGITAGVMIGGGIMTGNLPLVAIGLVSSATNKLLNIIMKQDTINLKRNEEDVSIRMQNIRAGTSGRRGNNQ